jgi:hypothetical protein
LHNNTKKMKQKPGLSTSGEETGVRAACAVSRDGRSRGGCSSEGSCPEGLTTPRDNENDEAEEDEEQQALLQKRKKGKTCSGNAWALMQQPYSYYEEATCTKRTEVLRRVIRLCVDNICDLIQKYGWHRVDRQMQHAARGREFICSMLYLMRMGITFKNQTILQKMEILNSLLPLQVFLPTIFNIRAKSITEGENIIKLDLQHIPL